MYRLKNWYRTSYHRLFHLDDRLLLILAGSVAGAQVSQAIIPEQVIFNHEPFLVGFSDILPSLCLAMVTAIISVFFTKSLRLSGKLAKITSLPLWIRAFLGGAIVGLIAMFMPVGLGECTT